MGNSFIVKQLIDQCGLLVFPLIFEEITYVIIKIEVRNCFNMGHAFVKKDIVLFVCLFKPLYLLSQMMQVVPINERSMRSKAIRFFL